MLAVTISGDILCPLSDTNRPYIEFHGYIDNKPPS